MKRTIEIWDEISPINGISAEEVLANRPDLASAHGDIFLVKENGVIVGIEVGQIIKANLGYAEDMTLQEIADLYLEKRIEMDEAEKIENLTVERLQEEVALLSYDVIMLQEPIDVLAAAGTHSPKFDLIRRWYNRGFWTEEMVMNVVEKNVITIEEAREILGK